MDFLTKYNATMDCKARIVSLENGDSIIKFRAQGRTSKRRWIFALKKDKMLQKGANGYLAHVQENIEDLIKIKDVLVVK